MNKIFEVKYKQAPSTQGNWSGFVQPTVILTAPNKKAAIAAAETAMCESANRQPVRDGLPKLKVASVREFKTMCMLDWNESN
jgi:hypothetical protein